MRRNNGWTLLLLACTMSVASGQSYTLQVRDTLEVPSIEPSGSTDVTVLIFEEIWSVYPSRPALYKEITGFRTMETGGETGDWPPETYRGTMDYEYELRDPQTGKEDIAFLPLLELVKKHSSLARNYDLGTCLISVRFSEDWVYDTLSRELTRKVLAITPVIWQRRQTTEGEPVNDGETGLPVYYKLEMEPIRLRNP